MSSALPSRGPHVRELFVNGNAGASFQYEQKESKASYNISSKKNRAPPPPTGLGQYKPKILSTDSDAIVPVRPEEGNPHRSPPTNHDAARVPVAPPRPSKRRASALSTSTATPPPEGAAGSSPKPLVMGDKDVPMVLHLSDEEMTSDTDYGTSDRQRLTSVEGMPGYAGRGTENPLFRMQDREGEEEGQRRSLASETGQQGLLLHNGVVHDQQVNVNGYEADGVYIPAPDYDEDEKTLELDDEDDLHPELRGHKVYKEYHGEDFAQYLSDEEGAGAELQAGRALTSRRSKPLHHHSHSHLTDRKAKTEAKRPQYKKRESVLASPGSLKSDKGGKGHKEKGKDKDKAVNSGRQSLRNFSYSDSKYGTVHGGDGHKRLSLPPALLLHNSAAEEAEMFMETGDSYETYLRQRNGQMPLGGAGAGEGEGSPGSPHGAAVPRYVQGSGSRDSLWKKMTWRFKSKVRNSFSVSS